MYETHRIGAQPILPAPARLTDAEELLSRPPLTNAATDTRLA
jgi:hypothetical protein